MERTIEPVFFRSCPVCGGPIETSRLEEGLPCSKHDVGKDRLVSIPLEEIKEEVTRKVARVERELKEFVEFFNKAVGNPPRSIQKIRMKRLLAGFNFSILAPTGMGKSTFSAVAALFYASKGKKAMIVLPTKVLVKQMYERIEEMRKRLGLNVRVIGYGLRKRDREAVERGEFDILIVTSTFLSFHVEKNINLLEVMRRRGEIFHLIIADDVDAILKGSKNVRRLLMLLGIKKETLDKVYEIFSKRGLTPEDRKRLEEIRNKILSGSPEYTVGRIGQLVVCTATGRVGRRARELFALLNFSVGSSREGIRNVIDAYVISELREEELERLARKLRDGIIVFVPVGAKDLIPRILEILKRANVKAGTDADKDIEAFSKGELNALVGTAYYYGRLVRGLDLPERMKYAIFIGTPKFIIRYGERPTLSSFLALAYAVLPALRGREYARIRGRIRRLLNLIQRLSMRTREALREYLATGNIVDDVKNIGDQIIEARNELVEMIKENAIDVSLTSVIVKHVGDKIEILIPDIRTYVQASGRTSRMYAGGVTKGLSVLIEKDKELVDKLIRRSKSVFDISRYRLEGDHLIDEDGNRIELDEIIREIEDERKRVREALSGTFDPVKPALFIVESPNKARTISRFFGRPGRIRVGNINAYEVLVGDKLLIITATGGHVFDLVTDEGKEPNEDLIYGVRVKEHASRIEPLYAPIVRVRLRTESSGYAPGQLIAPCDPSPDIKRKLVERFKEKIGEIDKDASKVIACLVPEVRRETHEEILTFVPKDVSSEPRKGRETEFEKYDIKYVRRIAEVQDKKGVIDSLRRLAYEAENVYIATDPDVEGEFIGRSVAINLKPFVKSIKRAEFHEVTVKAILNALKGSKEIDLNRVMAQIVRRIEDRRVGFGLSNRLQRKFDKGVEGLVDRVIAEMEEALRELHEDLVNSLSAGEDRMRALVRALNRFKTHLQNLPLNGYERIIFSPGTIYTIATNVAATYSKCFLESGDPSECYRKARDLLESLRGEVLKIAKLRIKALSAGRVQTPVLGRTIRREKYKMLILTASSEDGSDKFKIVLGGYSEDVDPEKLEKEINEKYNKLKPRRKSKAELFVEKVKDEVSTIPPQPPYTTDTLLADAARILGFSPEYTMKLAQDLFELGLITYHRTDSTRVSDVGIHIAREYIREKFGEDKFKARTRGKEAGPGIQAAHECIRPTRPLDEEDLKIAISVGDILVERDLTLDHYRLYDMIFRRFIASQMVEEEGRVIEYKIKAFTKDLEEVEITERRDVIIEEPRGRGLVRRLERPMYDKLSGRTYYISKVVKYPDLATEDRIVSEMRNKGIGRPSTYARIVETLKDRKYVTPIKVGRLTRLKPTERGRTVYEEVTSKFGHMVSEERTKELLERMDRVERGEIEAIEVLKELYEEFKNYILKALRELSR